MSRTDFHPLSSYLVPLQGYSLLPFRFKRLPEGGYLLTNDVGEHHFLAAEVFEAFVARILDTDATEYLNLRSKHFAADLRSSVHSRVLASKYRTKKSFLDGFTKLHIFVVSLRCDHSCPYCQVSRQSEDRLRFDMSQDTAEKAVDLMLSVPAKAVTCEFQGGEALLNFDILRHIVGYANDRNKAIGKRIDYVVCTNLSTLADDHLEFFKQHDIKVSTSLDGPPSLHDKNRPLTKGSSHALVERNIRRCQEALGLENLSALMTTTKESLKFGREIVDEYRRLNLGSIFLRSLSPYGFAVKTAKAIGYSAADFLVFYKEVLSYIIDLNRTGVTFVEANAAMMLQKILTPYPIGYVDLQSPAGAGFGVVVYNYDGDVHATDESRMLAEMDDKSFRLGNVHEDSYSEIFFGERMQAIAAASCNESLAGCSDCAYQPFCGADPVYHYATQGDIFGNRATSGFCQRNMAIFDYLFRILEKGDPQTMRIFWAWINQASTNETDLPRATWLPNLHDAAIQSV